MKQERLNDELTIVGLILLLLFLTYYIINYNYQNQKLHNKVIEAQSVAIYLNNELVKTESELTETKAELETTKSEVEESNLIKRILKDIATAWNSRRKD